MILNNQQAHILKKHFLLHMIFLERFGSKKLTITLLDEFDIFLASCLSIFSFNGLFMSSSIIFATTMFFFIFNYKRAPPLAEGDKWG
jgi:hypothetical protein